MLRTAAGRTLTNIGRRYQLSTRLGRLRLWKGITSPIEATLHEVWHGVQAEAMPEEYSGTFSSAWYFPDPGMNPLEFSELDSPLNPTDLAGAHDFGVTAKPPNALSPAALAAHLPIAFAAAQIYRR